MARIYRRKHFYAVVVGRSPNMCDHRPYREDSFCLVGYREPTPKEAMEFIGNPIYDRLYDIPIYVQEISKEEALRDFNMDGWRNQKVFGADEQICDFKSFPLKQEAPYGEEEDDNSPLCGNIAFCVSACGAEVAQMYIAIRNFVYLPNTDIFRSDYVGTAIGENAYGDFCVVIRNVLSNSIEDDFAAGIRAQLFGEAFQRILESRGLCCRAIDEDEVSHYNLLGVYREIKA